MKHIITLITALLTAFVAKATEQDLWQLHLAYHDAEHIVAVGTQLYTVMNGNVLIYDTEDQSQQTIDRLSGLSSKGVAHIGYASQAQCLVVLYEDNNIDLISTDGAITNLPQVKNFTETDITPKGINVGPRYTCITTTQGVILIDITRQEIRGYYPIATNIRDAAVIDDHLYAALTDGTIISTPLTANLYDRSQWSTALTLHVTAIVPTATAAYLLTPHNSANPSSLSGIVYMQPTSAEPSLTLVSSVSCTQGTISNNRPIFTGSGYVVTIDPADPLTEENRIALQADPPTRAARTTDGTYWVITQADSLESFTYNGQVNYTHAQVGQFGPRRDLCYNLRFTPEGRLLVAGGRINYTGGETDFPAMASYYDTEWHNLPTKGFTLNDGARYLDVLALQEDVNDKSIIYAASRAGLVEYRNDQFYQHYNASNSPLVIASGASGDKDYCIVDGLVYDKQGNLFLTNYGVDNTIVCITPDGQWHSFYDATFANNSSPEKMLFDSDGRLWVTSRYEMGTSLSGIYCLDLAGTLTDNSDDQSRFRTTATNEDGTTVTFGTTYDIKLDQNNQIWVAAGNGVFAITDPASFLTSSFTIYQPKVPRNDGTNYADYLLTGIPCSAIAIDQANRKWIGTLGYGIYLVSADGTEVISHFTSADSPLISDNIWSLAIHPTIGQLYIATDAGLCSYQTRITPAQTSLCKSNIRVYPNPVRPEYTGLLTITGLTDQAEVKIVTTSQQLVARLTSTAGTCQWNLTSSTTGQRVAPGVYYILLTQSDGSTSVATKIVVI